MFAKFTVFWILSVWLPRIMSGGGWLGGTDEPLAAVTDVLY